MAKSILTKRYTCSDDCLQSGCPSHIAILEYQSTSDSYKFDNGKGTITYFERGELDAFISLLKELSEFRVDSVRI
jgi:hypothetical protein